jgi:zinc protease
MKRLLLAAFVLIVSSTLFLGAEEIADIPGLSRFRLANGLEVYAYHDATASFARVQMVFKAGAIAQHAETAGLFRLYEYMLFGGPAAHTGSDQIKAALSELGVSEINGGTEAERVDYWLTLPSSNVAAGIDFWAKLLASPLTDEAALESEKEAVLDEIRSRTTDPEAIYEAALTRRLFPKYPWRRDPVGSEKTIRAATLSSIKSAVSEWFVPNNAALFVGGDIDPEVVRVAAEASFGSWKAGPDPWAKPLPPNPRPGVPRPTWVIFPDPSVPEGLGRIETRYRGPDLAYDPVGSCAADLWSALVAPADGRFKSALVKNVPELKADSIVAAHVSQRDGALISISSDFDVDAAAFAVSRAQAFKERARGYEITTMKGDPDYFSTADYETARKRLLSDRATATSTTQGMIETLAFWWAASSIDYFAGYPAAIAKTGPKEVAAFLDTYILRNLEIVAIRMNPADVEKGKRSFAASGFDTLSAANAFWWQTRP